MKYIVVYDDFFYRRTHAFTDDHQEFLAELVERETDAKWRKSAKQRAKEARVFEVAEVAR